MLSVNTNLSSLIAQSSLNNSTNALNIAIERMSTGYKLNHAKDNAANYSISTSIDTKLGAYNVAANNVAMGMDLVTTADGILNNMLDKANRLHGLCVQARNGTYGAQSLDAINAEVSALVAEITRVYNTAEYNNISLFAKKEYEVAPGMPQAGSSGFIDESFLPATKPKNGFIAEVVEETPDVIVTDPDDLKTAIQNNTKIGIANAETLQKLADLVNDEGITCSGKTIILTEDIDLSSISNWRPIGTSSKAFQGTFNGNGHTIKNLTINRPTESYVGLFGCVTGEIKNVGIVGGSVKGGQYTGSLIGSSSGTITNCYATSDVSGIQMTGGLVGGSRDVTNCYATGNVTGTGSRIGGLAGDARTITNSYATGDVKGGTNAAGLVGLVTTVKNSYATGNVTGSYYTGGLVGSTGGSINNSYATGDVTGNTTIAGGLAGKFGSITNCYATGNVTGRGATGGLAGSANGDVSSISNSYSVGIVSGTDTANTGSLIGSVGTSASISNCQSRPQEMSNIGNSTDDALLANITDVKINKLSTGLQVGINDDYTSQIEFDTNFTFDLSALTADITSDEALDCITDFIDLLSDKSTELGAIGNRLESALDSISVNIENLASSRSTIKDADIAKVSSQYIQQQILQQASATLLSTANQAPSIALQLI